MEKVNRFGIAILGLLAVFGLVLGAGANFRDYNASRSVHWDIVSDDTELIDLVALQPYAYINTTTGKLVIDFSPSNPNYPGYGNGISPAAEYNFDEVFGVSNHLWEEDMDIVVEIKSTNSHVELYGADGDVYSAYDGTLASASDSARDWVCFVVSHGQTVKIGVDLSANGDSPGDFWTGSLEIKAYRLGTEPAELAGKCGQP
ncbi:DUF1102 domain-containing protein [Pyrococcus sp. ST04]|uniref:DUF1102 domain-containing protein n=1 Tax=Pyrococcus sp. ST04 TaxID=1183377 RepID=UPI000260589C|nr:DUF1102 domain-containing protein [Pyrococcus sp. ST04]AFK22209.1 hypothetical protein Py04_0607 [Pyrococcus sp. ST04]